MQNDSFEVELNRKKLLLVGFLDVSCQSFETPIWMFPKIGVPSNHPF